MLVRVFFSIKPRHKRAFNTLKTFKCPKHPFLVSYAISSDPVALILRISTLFHKVQHFVGSYNIQYLRRAFVLWDLNIYEYWYILTWRCLDYFSFPQVSMKAFAPICFSYMGIILHFETRKIIIGPANEFFFVLIAYAQKLHSNAHTDVSS